MPVTSNYGFPTPSSGDDPDVPSDMLTLAQDIDTKLDSTISTNWITSSSLTGTYSGQQIKVWTKVGNFSTDANADTFVLLNAEWIGGGILSASGAGSSTFNILPAFRVTSGNLVARLLSCGTGGNTLAISTTVSMTFIVIGW